MNKLKCASFFAGVGGIDQGFEQQVVLKQYTLMSLTHILPKPLKKTLILKLTLGILTKYRVMKFPILM